MAEATEELVKVFLEQKGYLVQLSKRVDAKTTHYSPRAELDLIAILTNEKKEVTLKRTKLPKRVVGEVKSWRASVRNFKKLDQKLRKKHGYKSKPTYERFKWVNKKKYRKAILKAVSKEYSYDDFKFVLFCGEPIPKYRKDIINYLDGEGILLITHSEILDCLLEESNNEYTNNQILQLLRLMKKHFSIKNQV